MFFIVKEETTEVKNGIQPVSKNKKQCILHPSQKLQTNSWTIR